MKWIDTFLFNGDLITKLRLSYMYPHVDKFYVVEQRFTYQGQRKEALFIDLCKDWFEPYMDKIVFVVDEVLHPGSTWDREAKHREVVRPHLMKETGLMSICDADEIPDVNHVKRMKKSLHLMCNSGVVLLKQHFFYYNFKWYSGITTDRAFFINENLLKEPTTIQEFRESKGKVYCLLQCGWHFSYFMTKEDICRKLESFSHTECNLDKFKNASHVQKCIREGIDLFGRNLKFENYKDPLPKEFDEFKAYLESVQIE